MERSGPAPTALRRAGWPGGSGIGGAPAAATERLCYRAESGYMCLLVLVCMDVVSAGSPLHNDSLLPYRLSPAGLGRAGEEGQALLLPLPALAAAHALSLLPLCPAHGGWRCLGKHLGMDFSLSSSGHSLWALPGCCGRGAGCWTWIRLCNFQTGPAGGGCEEGPQPTDLLTLSSLSPLYSTPWQLPHLLLPQPSYARPSYARSWSPHIPSKTVDQTLPP